MSDLLTAGDVRAALEMMADDLTARAEELRALDAAIGDGDLGITVTLGFAAVREELAALEGQDIATLVMRAGLAFNRKAASTFGALFATMCMRAARVAKGLDALGVRELAGMFAAAAEGVKERGKSDVGQKTLLDALVPAAEALQAAAERGTTLAEAFTAAREAAEAGMVATEGLKSEVGRSSWFKERTVGVRDPGAMAVYLMVASLSAYVAQV